MIELVLGLSGTVRGGAHSKTAINNLGAMMYRSLGRALFDAMLAIFIAALIVAAIVKWSPVFAYDRGQWEGHDAALRTWFQHLYQPDTVFTKTDGTIGGVSCCGEGDGYWADDVHVRDGHVYAVITDDRDDHPLGRIHEDIGKEIEVPPTKVLGLEQKVGNPTGHTYIFLGPVYWMGGDRQPRSVLCYVPNGGV